MAGSMQTNASVRKRCKSKLLREGLGAIARLLLLLSSAARFRDVRGKVEQFWAPEVDGDTMSTSPPMAAASPPRIDARLPNKTGFLHLAQELQDQILEYALVERRAIQICLGGWNDGCMNCTTIMSLTKVSSKVRQDALDIFVDKNMFELKFCGTRYDDDYY
ncbi:uncharacterized protein MYCFIDRAFT_79294 [Pseudocercospora fijiensis CIRAD86]|uniref:Uncharacterized protein n=1 Tax=Pseudocercospora fijiensis (strain CIRAD86) TaxID=383855 RepID=M3A0Y2_PSEFD|nr:uncharacterized protein MYCFIDRAFT_79294 [Pseudocercospora fijiensis CIRAD86]EME78061.1 hypothetical protein MYCFIDRAFT_79294 [Pseudocercospora fijiensis CIRAD86]